MWILKFIFVSISCFCADLLLNKSIVFLFEQKWSPMEDKIIVGGHPLCSNKSNFWALYSLVRSWIKEWKDGFTKTIDKRFWSDPSTPFANPSPTCVRTLCMACRLTFIKFIYFRRVTLTFIMLAVCAKKQLSIAPLSRQGFLDPF